MSEERKIYKRSPCPNCGKRELIRILYGLPSPDMRERARRSEIALGGCMVTEHDPDYRCRHCAVHVYANGQFQLPDRWDSFDQHLLNDTQKS